MNSNIFDISEEDFETKVINASADKLIVVDFWAPWCGPCKQLTPTMEKVAQENQDHLDLVKINIDNNKQLAAQLRIQSIPTVYAFKDKQVVNAFQGVISEKDFIDFIEKSSGTKLNEDMSSFYLEINELMVKKEYNNAKDRLLNFLTENAKDSMAVSLYLDCLLSQKEFKEIDEFLPSLDQEVKNSKEIEKVIKKIKIVKSSTSFESIEKMHEEYEKNKNNTELLTKISEYYFAAGDYENAFNFLLDNFPRNKDIIKKKLVDFFEALGNEHGSTKKYRKKLSSLLFS